MVVSSCPTSHATGALPVLRVRAGDRVGLRVLSVDLPWVSTHYVDRQYFCPGEDCPLCFARAVREHGYLVVQTTSYRENRVFLLEVTPAAYEHMRALAMFEGEMRLLGLEVEASRRRANSPLRLEYSGHTQLPEDRIVPRWKIMTAISVLYQMPSPSEGEGDLAWATRVRPVAMQHAQAAANLL